MEDTQKKEGEKREGSLIKKKGPPNKNRNKYPRIFNLLGRGKPDARPSSHGALAGCYAGGKSL